MSDIRPAASLTSNLLARRGDARPAMRRQAISHLHVPLAGHEDLGWNDIGEDYEYPRPVTSLAGMSPPGPLDSRDDEEAPRAAHEAHEAEERAAPPAMSPLTQHLDAIAKRLNIDAKDRNLQPVMVQDEPAPPVQAPRLPAKPKAGRLARKAAFTLRIDPERHLRLRLLSAVTHRSSQQLLIEALDALLDSHGEIDGVAGKGALRAASQ